MAPGSGWHVYRDSGLNAWGIANNIVVVASGKRLVAVAMDDGKLKWDTCAKDVIDPFTVRYSMAMQPTGGRTIVRHTSGPRPIIIKPTSGN